MDDVTRNLQEDPHSLTRDLRAVVDDADALLRHAVRDAGAGYSDARARLEQSLSAAKDQLATMERAVAGRVRDAGRATDTYVHEHPWSAVGIGAGIGVLVGLLIGRR
ncbi:DUF883 family protein [Ramlibacter albus]|uniref:DUF883 domain-containing protein n=1 Tax=Ramlibacter albus TaxID=2079448 RepID=A0A923S113_9BURK|nr:DUF883 family protein [Ramlibacter albus]MBC5763939.1 DUF883 domain-containing protein [Ramlibacter albus]